MFWSLFKWIFAVASPRLGWREHSYTRNSNDIGPIIFFPMVFCPISLYKKRSSLQNQLGGFMLTADRVMDVKEPIGWVADPLLLQKNWMRIERRTTRKDYVLQYYVHLLKKIQAAIWIMNFMNHVFFFCQVLCWFIVWILCTWSSDNITLTDKPDKLPNVPVKTRYMDLRMWSSHHYYPLGILLAIPIDGLRPPFFNAILKIAIRSPQTPQTAKASSSLSSFFFFFLSSPGTISPGPVVNPFWAFQVRFQRGTMVPPSFGLSQDALVPTRKERYLMILMPWKTSQ